MPPREGDHIHGQKLRHCLPWETMSVQNTANDFQGRHLAQRILAAMTIVLTAQRRLPRSHTKKRQPWLTRLVIRRNRRTVTIPRRRSDSQSVYSSRAGSRCPKHKMTARTITADPPFWAQQCSSLDVGTSPIRRLPKHPPVEYLDPSDRAPEQQPVAAKRR